MSFFVLSMPDLLEAELVSIGDVVEVILGLRVGGEPDLAVCQQIHIHTVQQHLVGHRRAREPAQRFHYYCFIVTRLSKAH